MVLALALLAAGCAFTTRINLDDNAAQAVGGNTTEPAASADGRYVAFTSVADNLVAGDTNGVADVFVRDTQLGTTVRVSVSSSGAQALNGASGGPSISDDGRFVAFASEATNLVVNDLNGLSDVFVRDLVGSVTIRASVDTLGTETLGGPSAEPAISGDGSTVVFRSGATNLIGSDTNGLDDVFSRNIVTDLTSRVSVDGAGAEAVGGDSHSPALSETGRYVVFASEATNLVGSDANGLTDVFRRDTVGNTTVRVSVDDVGTEAVGGPSLEPVVSSDGRYVAFSSDATNLIGSDTNGFGDIFVRDIDLPSTVRVSVDSAGAEAVGGASTDPTISDDALFVAFRSDATNLTAVDTNALADVFLRDAALAVTSRTSETVNGFEAFGGESGEPTLSGDGRVLLYVSAATNLVGGDTNGVTDLFMRRSIEPVIDAISPITANRGETTTMTATGQNLGEVVGAIVIGGITAGPVTIISETEVEFDITVAHDATLGPRSPVLGSLGALATGATCTNCFDVTDPWSIVDPSPDIQAIHAALLPTGKVLIIEGDGWDINQAQTGPFRAGVWDPVTNAFNLITTPVDLFCSGHSHLPDGTLLISGGTAEWAPGVLEGEDNTYIFDPWTEQFNLVDPTGVGRWYPTVITLDDGRALTIGGLDENGIATLTYEIWDPATSSYSAPADFPGSASHAPLYAGLHLLDRPSTTLFHSGTYGIGSSPDVVPGIWDLVADTYTPVPGLREPGFVDQGASILLPPAQDQTVMVIGGGGYPLPATDRVDIVDLNAPSPAYVPAPAISESKLYVLAAILPDRTVIQAGGVDQNPVPGVTVQHRHDVQTYDHSHGTWTDRPPISVGRAYHSEIVLLDDGRVALLGGQVAQGPGERRIEILEPWYMNEERPVVSATPASITYGQSFNFTSTVAAGESIAYVELVRPSTPTHSVDPGHRLVDLDFSVVGSTVTATPNFTGTLAPPGYYMLNVVDTAGVPSVSEWVQLG